MYKAQRRLFVLSDKLIIVRGYVSPIDKAPVNSVNYLCDTKEKKLWIR